MWAKLGLAFQMRDDLLDILDTNTNKTYFSDLQEGNQTIIWDEVFKRVTDKQKEEILTYRWQQIDTKRQQDILAIIQWTWAIQATKDQVNTLLDEATTELSTIFDASNPLRAHIQEVIDFMKV